MDLDLSGTPLARILRGHRDLSSLLALGMSVLLLLVVQALSPLSGFTEFLSPEHDLLLPMLWGVIVVLHLVLLSSAIAATIRGSILRMSARWMRIVFMAEALLLFILILASNLLVYLLFVGFAGEGGPSVQRCVLMFGLFPLLCVGAYMTPFIAPSQRKNRLWFLSASIMILAVFQIALLLVDRIC